MPTPPSSFVFAASAASRAPKPVETGTSVVGACGAMAVSMGGDCSPWAPRRMIREARQRLAFSPLPSGLPVPTVRIGPMDLKLKPFDFNQAVARAGLRPDGQPLVAKLS